MADDISQTIMAKSDQLNASDLVGGSITVKITGVDVDAVAEQPVVIHIDGNRQPYKPCKSMRRLLANIWGLHSKSWVGSSLTLYCDPDVLWAGVKAGGIRVSHATGINQSKDIPLRASKRKVITYTVHPLLIKLDAYLDSDIEKNKAAWACSFSEGKSTPEKLIKQMEGRFTLTEKQKTMISGLTDNESE